MAKLSFQIVRGPTFTPDSVELSDDASNLCTAALADIEKANGKPISICVEIHPSVPGASVLIHRFGSERVIGICVGDLQHFKKNPNLFMPHELTHIQIQASGVLRIEAVNQSAAAGEMNSAILDISDHPFIWAAFQRHKLPWNSFTIDQQREHFSEKWAEQRTYGFTNHPLLNVKQYADYYFAAPDTYEFIKSQLAIVPNGKRVLKYLLDVEEVRREHGDDIYTIPGLRRVRGTLITRWQHQCRKVDDFAEGNGK